MFYRMNKLFYILIIICISDIYAKDTTDGGLDNVSDMMDMLGGMNTNMNFSDLRNININEIMKNSEKMVSTIAKSPLVDEKTKKEMVRIYNLWRQYGQDNTSVPVDFDKNKDITFQLYTQKNSAKGKTLLANDSSTFSDIDPKVPTKVLVHGVASTSEDMQTLKDAYIKTGTEYNIIMVDWRKGAFCANFTDIVRICLAVGDAIAKFIDTLDEDHKVGYIHIIAPNVASHIVGIAGNKAAKKIDRITGLDPVEIPDDYKNDSYMLGRSCAETVDVIHTSAEFAGCKKSLGTIDFYPNGGKVIQRGCGPVPIGYICSHARAYEYYVESVTSNTGFESFQCSDWDTFKKKECYKNDVVMMGEPVNTSATGNFYLETKFRSPFALVHHDVEKSSASHLGINNWKYIIAMFIVIFNVLLV